MIKTYAQGQAILTAANPTGTRVIARPGLTKSTPTNMIPIPLPLDRAPASSNVAVRAGTPLSNGHLGLSATARTEDLTLGNLPVWPLPACLFVPYPAVLLLFFVPYSAILQRLLMKFDPSGNFSVLSWPF